MGRGKVQLKRIEDKSSRQVTFSKRRSGLMKKASELSVLCDVDVGVFIFSGRGKMYEFSSGDSLRRILEHYQDHRDAEAAGGSVQESKNLPTEDTNQWSGTTLLQMVQRHFNEQKVEQLDVTELTQLEHQLDAILRQLNAILVQTRIRKSQLMMQAVAALHEKKKHLREEEQFMGKEDNQMAQMVNEESSSNSHHHHHHHHFQQSAAAAEEEDPVGDVEIYAGDNPNSSTTTTMRGPPPL